MGIEFIFVSPDDEYMAVIYQDESEMALLDKTGFVQFKMQIGPNITDVGFLDNERLEYFGKKRKTMLYSMSRHFVLRLISIPQQIMIFKFQLCIHRPMSNRFFIITKDLKTYTLTKNEFKEHTVFDQIT